jgi:hypothetical protein
LADVPRITGCSGFRARARCASISACGRIQDSVVRQRDDFVDFVRGAETIKEMNKRHAAFERGDMRNQRKVLGFLNAAGAQHGAAGLAHGHHVRVIAKDGERVGGNGTRGDVQYKGVSCPASLYSVGIINSNPWEEVNDVESAPV